MKKYLSIFTAFLLFTSTVRGQEDTPTLKTHSAIELNYARALWVNSTNAAGLAINPLRDYNIVSAQYNYTTGDYKPQQQGDHVRSAGFNTNGALRIGKIALWGNFTFSDDYVSGSTYNTNLYEPSPDMPYYVADPNKSDRKKQRYEMALKAAVLMGEKFALGANITYVTKKAAKQLDPRSTIFNYSIKIEPSFVFKFADSHSAGLSMVYENSFDRGNFENSLSYHDETVYIMKGLGNFSTGFVGGTNAIGTFYYTGNCFGSAFQYAFSTDETDILLELKYSSRKTEVFESPLKPRRRGDANNTLTGGTLQLLCKGDLTHKITLDIANSETKGVEYIQEHESDYEINRWVTIASYIKSRYKWLTANASYDLFVGYDNDYSWRTGLNAVYTNRYDEYLLPRSLFEVRNGYAELYARKNFRTSAQSKIMFGVNCGYNKNFDGKYDYNGPEAASPIVGDFYYNDLVYFSANYLQLGCNMDFSFALKSKSAININLDCQWTKAQSLHQNRTFIKTSVAYLF